MTQTDITAIEHTLIRTLRLTALRLRLAVVVEIVVEERRLIAIFGKEPLNLLILTH